MASVASFFISRVDTEPDRRLDAIESHDGLKGKLAIANAKLAYQTYKQVFSGADWRTCEPPEPPGSDAYGRRRQLRIPTTATSCMWKS